MRKIIFIFFVTVSNFLFSQQVFEICGESITHTYFSTFNGPGSNTWYVNGISYTGDELTYTFSQPGTYNIVLRRDNVICFDEETYQVIITQCPGILYWVPNSFTPDGDEHNQMFGPVMTEGHDVNDFSFSVFNRWGELIWETKDPGGRWDGTFGGRKCQDGVYSWKLKFNVFGNDDRIQDFGHVVLIK